MVSELWPLNSFPLVFSFSLLFIFKKKEKLDNAYALRERIRERNRLYQRRRRARMTEEQKNREKERRRQYMQNRRIQPVSYEAQLSPSANNRRAEEGDQNQQCAQQLRETMIATENNQGLGAGEAS